MLRLIALSAVVAVVLGFASLAPSGERASAGVVGVPDFDIDCQQTVDPADNNGVGVIECTLSITGLPDPPFPGGSISVSITVEYADRDGSNDPSPGDRLLCLRFTTPGGLSGEFGPACDGAPPPEPTPISPPASP